MAPAPDAFSRLEADARSEPILDAARRVFVRSGPAEASTSEIAREAGVTRGLVHHYFGTKRELYLAVVADLATTLPEVVRLDVRDLPVEQMVDATSPPGSTRSIATTTCGRRCSASSRSAATPRSRR